MAHAPDATGRLRVFETLISVDELRTSLQVPRPELVIIDCRFTLNAPEAGAQAYAASHLPNAVYAHLERDLSGPVVAGKTGRHPLPDPTRLAHTLEQWGIGSDTQVVAYDDAGGAFAARLWWLLGWLGHAAHAVLDGGWDAWLAHGGETSDKLPAPLRRTFPVKIRDRWVCTTAEIEAGLLHTPLPLFDARALERYAGDVEPIDSAAGHLPGARSLPFMDNLQSGRFQAPAVLRARLQAALGADPAECVMYCGSGVTACHNLLAAAHAGLPVPRLYAGSFSEWITDPGHAIATGRDGK